MGDVLGITESNGNLIAQYLYDEWGKLLEIETATENDAQQLEIANINPLRYRGYYYDNETSMYYLQNRYYEPNLCCFISCDDFDYIRPSLITTYINAYTYCHNSPVMASDPEGLDAPGDVGHQDWKYRIDNPNKPSRHMHLDSKQNGKHYAQNDDGSPHDKNNNSPGSPPKKVRKKLKEKTGWDWDAKEKSYEKKQKEENSSQGFSIDLEAVGQFAVQWVLPIVAFIVSLILALFGLPNPNPGFAPA